MRNTCLFGEYNMVRDTKACHHMLNEQWQQVKDMMMETGMKNGEVSEAVQIKKTLCRN